MPNVVTCNCHADESAKGRYDMIIVKYILTALGLNIKFYYHIIESDDETFKGYNTPMVDMGM